MKVIFTKTVDRVATMGETKDVKPGFARNFLFPRRLAILPSDPRAKALRKERARLAAEIAKERALLAELASQWRGQTFTLKARADETGTLYGSVGVKEIKKLLGRDDLTFDAPTLKTVGSHAIELKFRDGTIIPLTVVITPEVGK